VITGSILKSPWKKTAATIAAPNVTAAKSQSFLAMSTATGARVRPITTITGPVTTGGKSSRTRRLPTSKTKRAKSAYTSPAATTPPPTAARLNPAFWAARMGAMKANDEPKKTGTMPPVIRWKSRVPSPAVTSATEGWSPVKSGTKTVAPNIATACCKPRINFFSHVSSISLPPRSEA